MSEITLVPYTKFDAISLASRLGELVGTNRELLGQRHFVGVLDRYSRYTTARDSVRRGQAHHQSWEEGRRGDGGEYRHDASAHFAIVDPGHSRFGSDPARNVIGAASLQPRLTLRKLRLPVSPRVADMLPGLATQPLPGWRDEEGCNIRAWTDERADPAALKLRVVYQKLAELALTDATEVAWTLEPVGRMDISRAIGQTSLQYVGTNGMLARFDDAESHHTPPASSLFVSRRLQGIAA